MRKGYRKHRMAECHPNREHRALGLCDDCYRKKWNSENKDKRRKYTKDWTEKNPERAKEIVDKYQQSHRDVLLKRHRLWNERNYEKSSKKNHNSYISDNPDKHRAKRLRKYGLTVDDYRKMLDSQDGKCAICGKGNGNKVFAVDHDHKTGKVRELLCTTCNAGLGSLKDDIVLLEKAIVYLRKHENAQNLH